MTAGLIDFSILKGAPLVQTSGLGAFAEGLNNGLNSAADRSYKQNLGKASLADFQVKKQGLLADAAYAVSSLAPDQQEAGYNQTVGQFVKAGLVSPDEVPAWNQGGQQLVQGLAKTSSKYLENQKAQTDAYYKAANLKIAQQNADANTAKANSATVKTNQTTIVPSPDGGGTWQRIPGQGPLPGQQAQAVTDAVNQLPQIQKARDIYLTKDDKGNLSLNRFNVAASNSQISLPFVGEVGPEGIPSTEGRTARQNILRTVEVMLRLRTGAAAPEQEVERYASMYTPSVFDTAAQAAMKIDSLQNEFQNLLAAKGMQFVPNGAQMPAQQATENAQAMPQSIPSFEDAKKQYPNLTQDQYNAKVQGYKDYLKKIQASSQGMGLGAQIMQ